MLDPVQPLEYETGLLLEDLIMEFRPSKGLTLATETNHRTPLSGRKAWIKPPSSASSFSVAAQLGTSNNLFKVFI